MQARVWDPEAEKVKYVEVYGPDEQYRVAVLEQLDRIAGALERLVPNVFTGRP